MGFRDFQMFNWALLGKQAWRLATKPESLVGRVLKAKYFPHCTFMESTKGSSPSYTWRGIWEARWVLERGVRWRAVARRSRDRGSRIVRLAIGSSNSYKVMVLFEKEPRDGPVDGREGDDPISEP